jgi:transcriptional regulator with XRE-family HTH domain
MEQTIGRTIGAQVRALRAARGLTQDELAQAASVPQGNISRLERGDVHDVLVSTLLDLAKALHVDAMTLLQPATASKTKQTAKRPRASKDAIVPLDEVLSLEAGYRALAAENRQMAEEALAAATEVLS